MPNLVFELGCEELPASFVARASQDLEREVCARLSEMGVDFGEVRSLCTPRRLILGVFELPSQQPDKTVELRGPSESAAYQNGVASKALEGFCRGQGVDVGGVEVREGYVWVTRSEIGMPVGEVLAKILPDAVRSLTFDKTMRWGQSRMRFARPIRWILAVFDGGTVPFDIEGVQAGDCSRGHRFDYPEAFQALTFDDLIGGLRARNVEPDPVVREARIREQAIQVSSGVPDLPSKLVEENVFLTEWPTAHEGEYSLSFSGLPEPVLVTAMAKHERFFPVRSQSGELLNKFVSIRNSGEEDSVRAGNEWVLNARFNDAQFFYDEDRKRTMSEFLDLTERMLFQEKLGTIRQRAGRLSVLAMEVAKITGADANETECAQKAGLYCKADLSAGLVGELNSLQGVIGGVYAKREGLGDSVSWAIGSQYDHSLNHNPVDANGRTALRLIFADHLDKLVGFLGIGILPKGSSDPFGLRRSATVLIESAWYWSGLIPSFSEMIALAVAGYADQGIELDAEDIRTKLSSIFVGRYEALMADLKHDVFAAAVESATQEQLLNPKLIRTRAQALAVLDSDHALVQTMTRPINILAAAQKKADFELPDALNIESLNSGSGVLLAERVSSASTVVHQSLVNGDSEILVSELKKLSGSIHQFFEETMIMDEDRNIRSHRLKLVSETAEVLLSVGDFTKIVIEG